MNKTLIFISNISLIIAITQLFGCASTDRVVFVTSTEIGIGADAKIGNVNIGYDRNELVIGPVYPETGAAPPVYARLESNLSIIEPKTKQLYATGKAAKIVTTPVISGNLYNNDDDKKYEEKLYGERRLMVFGTSSNIGLKAHFMGNLPDSMNFGYKRKEISVIPLQSKAPTNKDSADKYASVIAGIGMDATAKEGVHATSMRISQFIATGTAANQVARDKQIVFRDEASRGLEFGAEHDGKIDAIIGYVAPKDAIDSAKLANLFQDAGITDANDTGRKYIEGASNANDLRKRLREAMPTTEYLYQALP